MIFTGRVEQIIEGVAYLTLRDESGQISYAEIDANQLSKNNIGDRDRFQVEVKDDIIFTKIPRKRLSESDIAQVEKKLDELLPGSLFDAD